MTLTPAYGRDYKSKKEVIEALNQKLDFYAIDVACGRNGYINLPQMPDGEYSVRYKKLTQVCIIKVKDHKII
jgi:hypothetical protein